MPGHPANLDWALVSAPADADATISVAFQVANVGDGRRPSTLAATIHPLKVVQANWPDSPSSTDFGDRHPKRILRDRIAYVTGEPAAPALTARFVGLPDGVGIGWRLDLTTEREHRKTLDDRCVPADGFAQTVGEALWDIAAALHEIVGGRAVLTVAIDNCPLGTYSFFIRGKNPKDADAKAFVTQSADPQFKPYAWAIVQHESRSKYDHRVYNQFNSTGKWLETPNMATDTNGWGMAQITTNIMHSTAMAWDWKENVRMVSTVLNMKREQFYVRFIGYFRETYGLLPDWCEPPLSWTIGNTTLSAEDWGILALYNGGGGIQKSYLPKHKPFHSPWVFIPQSDKKWDFLPNQNNYAEKVRRELEGLEPICE